MKNNFFLVLVALATLTLASCSSNLRVEKRHYNNGWYVQKGNHKQATGVATTTSPATTENTAVATTTEENTTVATVENTTTETQQAPQANPVQQKVSRTSTSSWARSAKAEEAKPVVEKATAPVKTAIKHIAKSAKMDSPAAGDEKFILAVIFAILFPCIGVLIWEGTITTHFWIALLLSFLFWIPGIIYALLVVTGTIG